MKTEIEEIKKIFPDANIEYNSSEYIEPDEGEIGEDRYTEPEISFEIGRRTCICIEKNHRGYELFINGDYATDERIQDFSKILKVIQSIKDLEDE